jgi:hypothetical protein
MHDSGVRKVNFLVMIQPLETVSCGHGDYVGASRETKKPRVYGTEDLENHRMKKVGRVAFDIPSSAII